MSESVSTTINLEVQLGALPDNIVKLIFNLTSTYLQTTKHVATKHRDRTSIRQKGKLFGITHTGLSMCAERSRTKLTKFGS